MFSTIFNVVFLSFRVLFNDPIVSGLQYTGVLGVFNCQGGGWCPVSRQNKSASEFSHRVTCCVSPRDIEWSSVKGMGVFAVYMLKNDELQLMRVSDKLEISLEPFTFELLTVSPVMVLSEKLIQFAPIGLVNMLNSGGAIRLVEIDENRKWVKVGVKVCGEMRVFASEKPVTCKIDGEAVKFDYKDKMVRFQVPWPSSSSVAVVEYLF